MLINLFEGVDGLTFYISQLTDEKETQELEVNDIFTA